MLTEQPLCPECQKEGRLIDAVDVDHIDNDPSNNERTNLVGLCHAHHASKTAAWMSGREGRVRGCDAAGNPLDASHPWRAGKSPEAIGHEPIGSLRARRRS